MLPTIYYDKDCSLCRSLALFVEKRTKAFRVESWQNAVAAMKQEGDLEDSLAQADRLRVLLDDETLLEGDAAWSYLLENYEGLSSLQWMFDRLDVSSYTAGRWLEQTGHLARRLCRSC